MVKIIKFTDSIKTITNENVPDKCIGVLPEETLIQLNCDENLFFVVCDNEVLLKNLIDLYYEKEISIVELKEIKRNKYDKIKNC